MIEMVKSGRLFLYPQLTLLLLAALAVPANGQTVAWSDLEGLTVLAETTRQQVVQRQQTIQLRVHDVMTVSIDPGNIINFLNNTTVHGPGGANRLEPAAATFTLEVTRPVARDGGGDAVWRFADGTLTFIRTFPSGARRMTFAFARGPNGLTCTASFAFAREDGGGPVRTVTPQGQPQTILSATQLSSQCKVVERK
jgi:hypothetical protein